MEAILKYDDTRARINYYNTIDKASEYLKFRYKLNRLDCGKYTR